MNKGQLITELAKTTKLSKADVMKTLDAFCHTVGKVVGKGQEVALVGFGTFKVAARKARTGINPQTGEKLKIKAKRVPKFRPGKNFKDAVG